MNVSEPKNEIKIRAEHVDFSYENTQTLFDINLEFRNHEVTALIGPSGCGKSTFLRTLSRMNELICDTTLKGKILLDGEDIYAPNYDVVQPKRSKKVCAVPRFGKKSRIASMRVPWAFRAANNSVFASPAPWPWNPKCS